MTTAPQEPLSRARPIWRPLLRSKANHKPKSSNGIRDEVINDFKPVLPFVGMIERTHRKRKNTQHCTIIATTSTFPLSICLDHLDTGHWKTPYRDGAKMKFAKPWGGANPITNKAVHIRKYNSNRRNYWSKPWFYFQLQPDYSKNLIAYSDLPETDQLTVSTSA